MRRSWVPRLAAALVLQALLVVVAVWEPLAARAAGQDVLLRVEPVDPIDPFRGAYVDLGYPDLPTVEDAPGGRDAAGDERGTVFLPLTPSGAVWVGGTPTRSRPADGLYLACDDQGRRLRCGIESLFLPQDAAREMERAVGAGGAVARVRVGPRGTAALLGVEPG